MFCISGIWSGLSIAETCETIDVDFGGIEYEIELNENVSEEAQPWVKAANNGEPGALYGVGLLYRNGILTSSDDELPFKLFVNAGKAGHVSAQLWIGITYLEKYYATHDEGERQVFLCGADYWLTKVISLDSKDSDGHQEDILEAKNILGTGLLGDSYLSERGWRLLKELAADGHEPALKTLIVAKEVLEDFEDEGNSDVPVLLKDLREFLESMSVEVGCDPSKL